MIGRTKAAIKGAAKRAGLDIKLYRPRNAPAARRARLLSKLGITLAIDVGANVGQYGRELRTNGYRGRIVSFEPVADAFARLTQSARNDPAWECIHLALGNQASDVSMNVAANLSSSSVLPMAGRHHLAMSESVYVRTETAQMTELDTLRDHVFRGHDPAFLKIDVQGYELDVLRGASETLPLIHALEVELSLVCLYEGQPLFCELVDHLAVRGYTLFSLEPAFADPESGRTLQMDGLFVREPKH